MITCEKDLEDYICNNQEEFIEKLKEIYNIDNIEFVGRQIKIGDDNIADLVYCFNEEIPPEPITYCKNYIIVELKYRQLEPKDLSQISRYMTLLREKLATETHKETRVLGLFTSFGCNQDMQNIQMQLLNNDFNDIDFLRIESRINFVEENYSWKDEYINNLKLDERLTKNANMEIKNE